MAVNRIKMVRNEYPVCEGVKWIDVMDPSPDEMEELSKQYSLNQHTVRGLHAT